MFINNMLAVLIMYKYLWVILLCVFLQSCQEKSWHEQIEKFSKEEIESFDLSGEGIINFPEEEIPIKTPYNDYPELAFKTLLNTNLFADCCAPEPQLNAIYYQVLMNQPDRKEVFLDLLERGERPGKLYALIALSEIDYELFIGKIEPHLYDTTEVIYFITDLVEYENFNQILVSEWSRKNLAPESEIIGWLSENPLSERDTLGDFNSYQKSDVINGGLKKNLNNLKNYPKLDRK